MKKAILIFVFVLLVPLHLKAQEWFTSFEVAKRLALVQNKLLFVMWEGSIEYDFPVAIFDKNGTVEIVLLSKNELVQQLIWEHFVPVKLPEYEYVEFSNQIKETRGLNYYNKLIDDSIKIMDVNGNILNTDESLDKYYFPDENGYLVIADFIIRYALDTSYLKYEFENYFREKNFISTFYLASKYLDYAIFAEKKIKPEITAMSKIYFDEAKKFLEIDSTDNKPALIQKMELLEIKEQLILNKPKKAKRLIKKIEEAQIDNINQQLYAFINYTISKFLEDEKEAALWESKISSIDLKMSKLILIQFGDTD